VICEIGSGERADGPIHAHTWFKLSPLQFEFGFDIFDVVGVATSVESSVIEERGCDDLDEYCDDCDATVAGRLAALPSAEGLGFTRFRDPMLQMAQVHERGDHQLAALKY
jgi:hypothetical protein